MQWIKDRTPTEEEQEQTDKGFIVCISGKANNRTYDHAIEMKIYFERGRWHDDNGLIDTETDDITVHGWMLPPRWEEGRMKTTMTPKERIELQVLIYKDLAKDNRRLLPAYENKTGWQAENYAATRARVTVYEMVVEKLEEILKDWDEEERKESK